MKIEHYDEDVSTTSRNFTGVDSATQSLSAILITEPSSPHLVTYVNAAWEGLCGMTSADAVGRPLTSIQANTFDRKALEDFTSASARLTSYKKSQIPEVIPSVLYTDETDISIVCFNDVHMDPLDDLDDIHELYDANLVIDNMLKRKRRSSLGSGPFINSINCNVNLDVQHERWAKRRNELLSYFVESTTEHSSFSSNFDAMTETPTTNFVESIMNSSSFWDDIVTMDQEVQKNILCMIIFIIFIIHIACYIFRFFLFFNLLSITFILFPSLLKIL